MHHYTTVHLYDGDTIRRGSDTNVPYLSVDGPTEYGAITLHFGAGASLAQPTLAIAQLDQLLAVAAELRNDLAASVGRAPVVIVPVGPDGPDDPTDEPTDEPATDVPAFRCARCHHTRRPSHTTDRGDSVPCRFGSCGCPGYVTQAELDRGADRDRDPVEVYGTPEHEAWLMELERSEP